MYIAGKYESTILKGFFFLFVLLLVTFVSFGQTRFSNGKIIYSIDVKSTGDLPPGTVSTLENGEMIFYFKNHLFRSEMHIGNMEYINIYNSNDHSALSLIKGGEGKNYLVKMSPEEVQKEAEKYQGMTYTTEPGTLEIAGFTCHKAVGKLADGKEFVVFYTTELKPSASGYSPRFKGLEGVPLKFEVNTESNAKLVMTATKIEKGFQPSSLFDIPTRGFRKLSYEQLQKLRNSK